MGANVSVTLDEGGRRALRDALRQAGPTILDTIRDGAERVMAAAVNRWPVGRPLRTGRLANPIHSRDRFSIVERVTHDVVEVSLTNAAPYTRFIKSMQHGLGGKSAWQVLVRRPWAVEAKRIVDESGDELRRLAGGA